jgi:hypothetical protein
MTRILPPYAGRIAHLSDIHLTDSTAEPTGLAEQRAELLELVGRINGAWPNLWALTGDIFGHTVPYRSTAAERNAFADVLRAMADQAPVIVLSGNHDGANELDLFARIEAKWPIYVVKELGAFSITASGAISTSKSTSTTEAISSKGSITTTNCAARAGFKATSTTTSNSTTSCEQYWDWCGALCRNTEHLATRDLLPIAGERAFRQLAGEKAYCICLRLPFHESQTSIRWSHQE